MQANFKRQKTSPSIDAIGPISSSLLSFESRLVLTKEHSNATPYKHVILSHLCEDDFMRSVHDEVKLNMTATFKESDLFKVFQTGDLGVLESAKKNVKAQVPHLLQLQTALYSVEFRQFISDITACGELTDRIDCSINAYTNGCHLLCHDDVIGTRRVSYIIYLTDPDIDWSAEDGGALELYPLEESSKVDRGLAYGGFQGVPEPAPTKSILPVFNTMAIFIVQPGRSYHAVQENYSDKPRLSISGWYHQKDRPIGSDFASLSQIMTKGDDDRPFYPIPSHIYTSSSLSAAVDSEFLSDADRAFLSDYLNPEYLQPRVMSSIADHFSDQSSIQLQGFLKTDLADKIKELMKAADDRDCVGHGRPPKNLSYTLGADSEDGWALIGPPHKQRYLQLQKVAHDPMVKVAESEATNGVMTAGTILHQVYAGVFRSAEFVRYLNAVTSLSVCGFRGDIRRFRPGLDYTVAHFGTMTGRPRLDTVLCFVAAIEDEDTEEDGDGGEVEERSDDESVGELGDIEDEDAEEEDERQVWASGDLGGFECYIAAEEDDGGNAAEAAEVFKMSRGNTSSATAGGEDEQAQDEESSLLSVKPGFNVLNIVLRDEKVMRFVKYVSAQAPSSRWDISVEYEIASSD